MNQPSDKKSSKTVLVGMTGRLDSTVAAYLLKKQGYKVIGVTLMMMDRELIELTEEEKEENKNKKVEPEYEVTGTCYIEDLKHVQNICEQLDIGFYAIDAKKRYQDLVTDYIVSARLSGIDFNPCVACNQVKVEILLEKAEVLKADFISTGHYAKIFTNHQNGECSLLSANDQDYDQSFFLSALSKDQLKKILLPFGDIRRIEVEKIAKSLNLNLPFKKTEKKKLCFMDDKRLGYFVEKRSPESLREGGTIVDYEENITHGEHKGIHLYKPGDTSLIDADGTHLDKEFQVLYNDPRSQIVYITKKKEIFWNRLTLSNCNFDEKSDISKPIPAFIMIYPSEEKVECTLTVREGRNALVEVHTLQKGLLNYNKMVTLLSSNKIGAKILGSGVIKSFHHYERGIWKVFPDPIELREDEEPERGKPSEIMEF